MSHTDPVTAEATPVRRRRWPWALAIGLVVGGVAAAAFVTRGTGIKTRMYQAIGIDTKLQHARVISARPGHKEMDVPLDTSIAAQVSMPNGPIDPASLTAESVYLVRAADQKRIASEISTYGDDMAMLRPTAKLDPATKYTLVLTPKILDTDGVNLVPSRISFTTVGNADPSIQFEKVALSNLPQVGYTSVLVTPDRTFYATTIDGRILRSAIQPDGTLAEPKISQALPAKWGGPRLIGGLCLDPDSTPEDPAVWVTHTYLGFKDVPDFQGALSRISGKELDMVQDVLINLPRSSRDHITFQPSIGPDGALYFHQGSSSAFGDPDADWGNREEHLLTASMLRLDLKAIDPDKTIDVKTVDAGGPYDPFAPGAPLTIYAEGIRVAYDMAWLPDGSLIVPVNGSSSGGNAPAGPDSPALKAIDTAESDYLHRVLPGKYYGHPNPKQERFVLNGANPTDGVDVAEFTQYPVGTLPDPDYQQPLLDFGLHVSPNGILQYKSDVFDGKLKDSLIVCRYNFGSDLVAIHLGPDGKVASKQVGIIGLTGFNAPLDVTEDPATGSLYVSEFGSEKITLLRPAASAATPLAAPPPVSATEAAGGTN